MTTATPATEPVGRGTARRSNLDRSTAMRMAETEYGRFVDQARGLSAADWTQPTCCPDWDVRLMICHVIAMAELAASPVEQMRQMRAAKRTGGLFINALTAVQVDKHADRTTADLVGRMSRVAPRAVRGRRRTPSVIRRRGLAEQPVTADGSVTETWAIGYLTDVILTRDVWMHRTDIAAATGHPLVLTAEHDGALVSHVVVEWAERHGQPFSLVLTGPAGGTWSRGAGSAYQLDAVEFCRIVSGRSPGDGLLTTAVPF